MESTWREQTIDAGRDHSQAFYRAPRWLVSIAPRTIASSSSTASSRRSFTTTCVNSPCAASSRSAVASRRSTSSGSSVPRPTSRARSASREGGAMKIWTASGSVGPHLARALHLDLQHDRPPPPCRELELRARVP